MPAVRTVAFRAMPVTMPGRAIGRTSDEREDLAAEEPEPVDRERGQRRRG